MYAYVKVNANVVIFLETFYC